MNKSYITRTVIIVSLVSLFNDMSSELLYPIIPLYIVHLGVAPLYMGIIEGIAELTASVLKIVSGNSSDHTGKRKPYILAGYSSSVLARGLLAVSTGWVGLLVARCIDKVGKGLRSPARDALLGDECTDNNRGAVFGLHRSADTLGAVLGQLIALALLYYAFTFKQIFIIAIFPGIIGIVFLLFLKEKKADVKPSGATALKEVFAFWKNSDTPYKTLIMWLLAFALFNSSDMYLLAKLKQDGLSNYQCVLFYIGFNIVYMLAAFPIGKWSDGVSKKYILAIGFVLYAIAYFCIGNYKSIQGYAIGFGLYGLYYAFTDGVSKAMILSTIDKSNKARALGLFSTLQGIAMLVAGIITGLLWQNFDARIALNTIAIATALLAICWVFINQNKATNQQMA